MLAICYIENVFAVDICDYFFRLKKERFFDLFVGNKYDLFANMELGIQYFRRREFG
jgi:hypothetical protein